MNNDCLASILSCAPPIIALTVMVVVFSVINKSTNELSEKYPVCSNFVGTWSFPKSVKLGWLRLNNCVSIGIAPGYLCMKASFWPAKFQAQIPWSAIRSIERQKIFWMNCYEIKLRDSSQIIISRVDDIEEQIKLNPEASKLLSQSNLGELG